MRRHISIALFVLLCSIIISNAATRRVPQDYSKIQLAINAAANGDTVVISEGTYKENLVLNKKITLAGLYLFDKDTSHISKTIIDGSAPTNPDSGSVIAVGSSTDSTTVITGLTITKGTGTKHANTFYGVSIVTGGGIDVNSGGATIKNNIIRGNTIIIFPPYTEAYGGGISFLNIDWPVPNKYSIIESNLVSENNLAGGINAAGGIEFWSVDGRIVNNTILKNNSYSVGGVEAGNTGGYGLKTVTIQGNLIRENIASAFAGGISISGKGSSGTINNNMIVNNKANQIGGMFIHDSCYAVIDGNYVSGNIALNGNNGGIYFERNQKYCIVQNNIVRNNNGCGIGTNMNSVALIINNTVVGNSSYGIIAYTGSYASAMNNIVRGNTGAAFAGSIYSSSNFTLDPQFVTNDTLYHLTDVSQCIGNGTSSAVLGGLTLNAPEWDYFNTLRPRAAGTKPDIGAVEHDLPSVIGSVINIADMPALFCLEQNYPNPFNPSTTIRYALPASVQVKLIVYDLIGREIAILVNEEQTAGWKEVQWNAGSISSSIYFYKLFAGNFSEAKKMSLIR